MRPLLATSVLLIAVLASAGAQGQLVGGDRHKSPHGCIASAGYSWCESKGKCLKIWEEECPSPSSSSSVDGKAAADSKCSNGRTWCETMGQCMAATSMIACPEAGSDPSSSPTPERCQTSAGFMWCDKKSKCLQPWVETCNPAGTPLHAGKNKGGTNNNKETVSTAVVKPHSLEITDKMDLAQHQQAADASGSKMKGRKSGGGGARRVSVVPGQDTCMSMIEGEELCEKTGTCMPVEDCERILPDGQTNQVGYQHGVKPQCESMVMGVEWCEKAKRCMSSSECAKLDL